MINDRMAGVFVLTDSFNIKRLQTFYQVFQKSHTIIQGIDLLFCVFQSLKNQYDEFLFA